MKNKLLKILLVIMAFSFAMFTFIACDGGDCKNCSCDGDQNTIERKTDYFTFTQEIGEMVVGDTYYVYVDYNYQDGSEIVYSSSNPEVASVDSLGKIEALRPGTATITGKWQGIEDTMQIDVVTNGMLPELRFDYGLMTETENYLVTDTYKINAFVLFNSRKFYDAKVTYTLNTEEFGVMDGDSFVSNQKTGEVEITVKAEWRGIDSPALTKTVKLKFINGLELVIDGVGSEIALYTVDTDDYDKKLDLNGKITAKYLDQEVPFDVKVIDNVARPHDVYDDALNPFTGKAVSLSNNVITAMQEGSAKLEITLHTDDPALGDVKLYRYISVTRPTQQVDDVVELFSKDDGVINGLSDIIGADATITEAYQNGRLLTVEDNKIFDIRNRSITSVSSEEITICTSTYKYVCTFEVYEKVIYSIEDFGALCVGATQANPKTGYVILANDIVYDSTNALEVDTTTYFAGVFDGNGKSITGPLYKGLFGFLGAGTKITNVSIKIDGVKSTRDSDYAILAYRTGGTSKSKVTIENVYLSFDIPQTFNFNYAKGKQAIGLFNRRPAYIVYNNVFVDMTGIKSEFDIANVNSLGVLLGYEPYGLYGSSGMFTFTNSFVINNNPYIAYYDGKHPDSGNANSANHNKYLQIVCFAENESESVTNNFTFPQLDESVKTMTLDKQTVIYENLYRYGSASQVKQYFKDNPEDLEAFTAFVDTELGYPSLGGVEAYVKENTKVKIDGEKKDAHTFAFSEGGSITLSMDFEGRHITSVRVEKLSGEDVVSVDGATVTYVEGKLGGEKLKVIATVEGYEVEKIVSVSVSVQEIEGEIMYSTRDNTALLPKSLDGVRVTKLVSVADGEIYYNGAVYENVPQNDNSLTGDAISSAKASEALDSVLPTYSVYVYGENDELLGQMTMKSYTKVLTSQADFKDVFATCDASDSGVGYSTRLGYYILANEVTYTSKVNTLLTGNKFNLFRGYFDGNGQTVNAHIQGGGLMGDLGEGAVVSDLSVVVKEATSHQIGNVRYSAALAHKGNKSTLENVYMRYDLAISNGAWASSGDSRNVYGFYSTESKNLIYKNVILDISKVSVQEVGESATYYAAPILGYSKDSTVDKVEDLYVIHNGSYVEYSKASGTVNRILFAENDSVAMNAFITANQALTDVVSAQQGLYAYGSYNDLVKAVGGNDAQYVQLGDFYVTKSGVYLDFEEVIKDVTLTTVNGEQGSSYEFNPAIGGTITLGLEYNNASVEGVRVEKLSGFDIVSIDGVAVTYIAGTVGGEKLKLTATVEGVVVEKIIDVSVVIEQLQGEIIYSFRDSTAHLPTALGAISDISKITLSDGTVVYDGSAWTLPEEALAINTKTGTQIKSAIDSGTLDDIMPTLTVYVYGEAGELLGQIAMKSYTKVLTSRDDFFKEFGSVDEGTATKTFNTRTGYYIVANNINFTTDYAQRVPTTFVNGSYVNNLFKGYFDGNGKTVDAYIEGGGLFGDLDNAYITDLKLNVIQMYNVNTNRGDISGVAIAQTANNSTLENVYIYYDEAVTVSYVAGTTERHLVEGAYTGTYEKSMYGLFSAKSQNNAYKNVILDMSKLVVSAYNGTSDYYAAPIYGGNMSSTLKSVEGLYVIQESSIVDYCHNKYGTRIVFAQNDATGEGNALDTFKAENTALADKAKALNGMYRYDSLEALAGAVSETGKIGNFEVTAGGVNWVGSGN